MIQLKDKSNCCGCTACATICPHDAISMKPDAMGFLYPNIDYTLCVDCHLCEKVCAFNENYDKYLNLSQPIAFGARHIDMKEIEKSRSGAAFVALSDLVLDNGGVIYGAGYKDHFRVAHKRATNREQRDEFRESKYVQSDLSGVFKAVLADLENGLIVLFSGTPCQTAGLNSFIGKKLRENLILVDIVCHGVPGPYLWRDYIEYIEKKYKDIVSEVHFRDKHKYGWRSHKESFKLLNGLDITSGTYTFLFYEHIMFRHSCGVCPYTNIYRPSDITIADFWGWEKINPDFNSDDKGASLILLNTDKGVQLFEKIKNKMIVIRVNIEDCLQPNLCYPSIINSNREKFEKDYTRKGIVYVMKKYADLGWKFKLRLLVKKVIFHIKKIINV